LSGHDKVGGAWKKKKHQRDARSDFYFPENNSSPIRLMPAFLLFRVGSVTLDASMEQRAYQHSRIEDHRRETRGLWLPFRAIRDFGAGREKIVRGVTGTDVVVHFLDR
jgi:hypothetical protein